MVSSTLSLHHPLPFSCRHPHSLHTHPISTSPSGASCRHGMRVVPPASANLLRHHAHVALATPAPANRILWPCTKGWPCSGAVSAPSHLLCGRRFPQDSPFSATAFCKGLRVRVRVSVGLGGMCRLSRSRNVEPLCGILRSEFWKRIGKTRWSERSLHPRQFGLSSPRVRRKIGVSEFHKAISESDDFSFTYGVPLASSTGGYSYQQPNPNRDDGGCAASISVLKRASQSSNVGKLKPQGPQFSDENQNSDSEDLKHLTRLQRLSLENREGSFWARDLEKVQEKSNEAKGLELRTIQERLEKVRDAGKQGLFKGVSYTVNPHRLVTGEYVVHKRVGVGRFVALKDERPNGKQKPITYVYLKYADGMAKLPANQAHRLLYRYNRAGESCKKAPTLNKLHDTSSWESKKSLGRLAIQKLVVTMVEQTVRRLKQKRPCYPKNSEKAAEFAALFRHTPTRDQQNAFKDVEKDMTERESPMDRLICGDVGFGKTEIALRAIFIAVASGKQAMLLAPTTVLAKQHHQVISDRFSTFSNIKIALLTRFQKGPEKKVLLEKIRSGSLDIIIGTHGLLSEQMQYGKLGLLVVDEEQRFGVKQKERISSLKATVDVLTLSATPIPRTLYMALNGFRDVSLLTTPPSQRLPVLTRISEYSDSDVKAAIKFELDRGGQVFYVVPRIKDIDLKKSLILSLFPNVEVFIAHGQQNISLLESTMDKFSNGEGHILLCSSIIESGVDIARVNTIILEDAHLFGLAQLYQLRGRVGRGERQGHAYLFHPPTTIMTAESLQRVNALKECCGLGQGFQLAEKDMTIRGIGSVFSEKQSGDTSSLGVDLYAEMLFESLASEEYLGLPQVDYDKVQLDMELDTHIPSEYISSSEQRDLLIEEANQAARDGMKALMKFTTRLRAEFGSEPVPVQRFLKAIYVRKMAADLGIHRIMANNGQPIILETTMGAQAFALICNSIGSVPLQNSLILKDGFIELQRAGIYLTQPSIDYIFSSLTEMRNCLPSFIHYNK